MLKLRKWENFAQMFSEETKFGKVNFVKETISRSRLRRLQLSKFPLCPCVSSNDNKHIRAKIKCIISYRNPTVFNIQTTLLCCR
jgi:hypothetical protein